MRFTYIPDAFFTFCKSVDKNIDFSHTEVALTIKGNWFVASLIG